MKRFLLLGLVSAVAHASLSIGTTWEVRLSNGSDSNGGGYASGGGGTDYSQQNSAQVAYTDISVQATTTTFKSTAHAPLAAYVGNIIQIVSGTGCTTGFFEVTAVNTSTNVYTVDRSLGSSGDTCTGNLGGALKTLSKMITAMGTTGGIYQIAWVKAEAAYTTTSQLNYNVSGSNGGVGSIVGYSSARGDNGQFTITASTTTGTTWLLFSNPANLQNAIVNCSSLGTSTGIESNNGSSQVQTHMENVEVENCTTVGFDFNTSAMCVNCYATGNSGTAAFNFVSVAAFCYACQAIANTTVGFIYNDSANSVAGAMCVFCISANNTGASSDGFNSTGSDQASLRCFGCVGYGNGRDGYRWTCTGQSQPVIVNSIFVNNSAYGLDNTASTCSLVASNLITLNNVLYNNSTANYNNWPTGPGDVTCSASPFVNGGSNNFALSTSSSCFASVAGTGFPGVLQAGGTGYLSIGAVQPPVNQPSSVQHGAAIVQ